MNGQNREHQFTPTTLFIAGSLLIWLGNFVFVYVIAALACARGFSGLRLLGLPIVPMLTTLSSVAAGLVTLVLLRKGSLIVRDSALSEHSRFIGFVALATSVLAIIALVLLALPSLVVSGCATR